MWTIIFYADQQRNAFAWNIALDLRKKDVHLPFFSDFETTTRSIYSISSLIIFDLALVQNYAPLVVRWPDLVQSLKDLARHPHIKFKGCPRGIT